MAFKRSAVRLRSAPPLNKHLSIKRIEEAGSGVTDQVTTGAKNVAFEHAVKSDIEQAFARLSMLEFVVEVMMANWLADIPPEAEAEFIATMRRRSRSMWIADQPGAGEDKALHRTMKLSVEMADHFMDKVTARAAEVREHRSRL